LIGTVILYVDYEHASTYRKAHGEWLYASRTRVSYKLQDVTGNAACFSATPTSIAA
jgi:hypothetical protein